MATNSKTQRIKPAPKAKSKSAPKAKAVASNGIVTVTVAELRSNFKAVEAKLTKGVRVQITRRGTVIAEMSPPPQSASASEPSQKFELPDFKARLRQIWGDKPLDIDTTELVSWGRDRDL